LDVVDSRILSGGSSTDNINLILDSSGSVNKYPTSTVMQQNFKASGYLLANTNLSPDEVQVYLQVVPTEGDFKVEDVIQIGTEEMRISVMSSPTASNFTVIRGINGTTIGSWDRDEPINIRLEDISIQTKDLFFEKGVLRRMKVDYEGGTPDITSNMTTLLTNGSEAINTNTISAPNPNQWRGIALQNSRGNTVSFGINGADTIKSIMYDLRVEE